MFQSSPYATTVGSKSTIVPSDHQQDYRDGETMRFEVPSFMSYIDPRQSYLKFQIGIQNSSATNHIRLKLDETVGAQGVIDRIRIYDGNSQIQLENLENYAEFVATKNHYTRNESIQNKRELLEGTEKTTTFTEGSLFDAYPETPVGTTINASVDMNPNTLEIAMPLHSGVLGGRSLFPVELFDGLRVEIDLNDAGKYLKNFNNIGLDPAVGGLPFANGTAIATGGAGSATIDLFGTSVFANGEVQSADSTITMSNLKVGDTISGIVADSSTEVLGTVLSIELVAQGGAFASDHIRITLTAPYNPATAAKDLPVWTSGTDPLGQVFITTGQYDSAIPRVSIRNVELVLKQITPPAGLVEQYAKAIQTAEGVQMDIMTYETYRNNVQSGETVSQIQIPSYNSRAKAIICLPMNNGLAQTLTNDNLKTTLDNIREYQFYINGQPQPTRSVNVSSLSKTIPTASQIALWELEKSFTTCSWDVRELRLPHSNFAIARPFARYGGVYNLKDVGGCALKQEYDAPTQNKLILSFVGHLRRLVVNTGGKIVEL